MTDIISLHYNELLLMARDKDRMVAEARTDDDWLNDVCLTALQKFRDKEIEEEEGIEYLKKSLLMSLKFKWKKIDSKLISLDDIILR